MLLVSSGRSNPRGRRVSPSTKHQAFSARRCPPPQIFQRTATRALAALPNSPWCCSVQAEGKSLFRTGTAFLLLCTYQTGPLRYQRAGSVPSASPLPYPEARGTGGDSSAGVASRCLLPNPHHLFQERNLDENQAELKWPELDRTVTRVPAKKSI